MAESQNQHFPATAGASSNSIRIEDNRIGEESGARNMEPLSNEWEGFPVFPSFQNVLLSSFLYHGRDVLLSLTLGTIYIPFDRVATLLTVEGELKRQHILPMKKGFGGIRQCWLQLWRREGLLGCVRSSMWTPLLRFPSRLLGDLLSHAICHFFFQRYSIEPSVVMALAIVISMLLVAPYNFWQRTVRTMFRADLKTVLISSSCETQRVTTPPSSCSESGEKKKKSSRSWWRRIFSGRNDVRYHFPHLFSTAARLGQRLHNARLIASCVCLEFLYKNTFMWGFPIVLRSFPVLGSSAFGRGACLLVRDLAVQPFRVIMGRLAVSSAFSTSNPVPANAESDSGSAEAELVNEEDEVSSKEKTLPRPRMYNSVCDCAAVTVQEDGVRSLWAGLRYRLLLSFMAWMNSILVPPAVEGIY